MKFDICLFFKTLSRQFKFHSNLTRITGTVHEDLYTFLIKFRSILHRVKNVSDKCCREHQNTYLYSITFFNCAVYEIMWKNIVEPEGSRMT